MKNTLECRSLKTVFILKTILLATVFTTCLAVINVHAQNPYYTGKVSPTPQKVIGDWKILHLAKNGVEVITGKGCHNAVGLAKNMLLERVEEYSAKCTGSSNNKLKIYLGLFGDKTIEKAVEKYKLKLDKSIFPANTDISEGYAIRIVNGANPVIIAAGVDHRGAYFAAMTLLQSIGAVNKQLILRCADINDWPRWKHRFLADQRIPTAKNLLSISKFKVNSFALQYRAEWRKFKPDSIYKPWKISYEKAFTKLKKFKERYDLMDYMLLINIYAAKPRKYPMFDITQEEDIAQLIERCRFVIKMGFNHVMILVDDWTPTQKGNYVCPHEAEKKKFNNSVGKAHGYLMRRLYKALKPKYPDLTLAICPAPYSIYGHRIPEKPEHQNYLRDMAEEMPEEVYVVWTGPVVRSKTVSKKDYDLYTSYMKGHKRSYLFDNSADRPIPRWETKFYDKFVDDSQGYIYINTFLLSWPWLTPFSLGVNDYLWNPGGYNSIKSHRDIVEKLYGKGTYPPVGKYIKNYNLLSAGNKNGDFREIDDALAKMKKQRMSVRRPGAAVKRLRSKFNAKVPEIKIKRFKQPPVIDGQITDKCWGKAESFSFKPWMKNGKVDSTKGKIGHDGKNLYLAFSMKHNAPLKTAIIKKHDGPVYAMSDSCEIFLLGEKPKGYGHFAFDHMGNIFEETRVQSLGAAWNPEWEVKIKKYNGTWTAEVKIPLAAMGPVIETPVGKGTIWRANFCRSYSSAGQLSCWSPTYGNRFNTVEFFGRIIFE